MATHIPTLTRRDFLRLSAVSVSGYSLLPMLQPVNVHATEGVKPRGGAEICILLFLQGGPSQLDTFSVKEGHWTPPDFDVRQVKPGLKMPFGLLPKLAERHDKYALIRSLESWEADHGRGEYYLQAARIISPARQREIPSVGSVLAYETMHKRKDSDFLPPFISMNMNFGSLVGCGMLNSKFAPMAMKTSSPPPFAMDEGEKIRFARKTELLKKLDYQWRGEDSHRGRIFKDIDQYYQSAMPLLDNPKASPVFKVSDEDRQRYGKSGVGDACAIARNLVEADAGTRFVFISHGSWDLHDGLYDGNMNRQNFAGGQYRMCREIDPAISSLLDDLEAKKDKDGRRLIDKTMIIAMGEFGRTPGDPNLRNGRDHYRYAGVGLFAGAGIKSKVIGDTDEKGARVTETGWHLKRSIYPEDVLVTMYSAMGVDWKKKIEQTPSGRVFDYIEDISPSGVMYFEEINELFV